MQPWHGLVVTVVRPARGPGGAAERAAGGTASAAPSESPGLSIRPGVNHSVNQVSTEGLIVSSAREKFSINLASEMASEGASPDNSQTQQDPEGVSPSPDGGRGIVLGSDQVVTTSLCLGFRVILRYHESLRCYPEPGCSVLANLCYSLRANRRSRMTLHGSAFPHQTLTASSLSPLTKWSSGPASQNAEGLVGFSGGTPPGRQPHPHTETHPDRDPNPKTTLPNETTTPP